MSTIQPKPGILECAPRSEILQTVADRYLLLTQAQGIFHVRMERCDDETGSERSILNRPIGLTARRTSEGQYTKIPGRRADTPYQRNQVDEPYSYQDLLPQNTHASSW
jgi:hypothetical protein